MSDLEALDDSGFERVLVVVAHPDDAEYGLSAAVARWTAAGAAVTYLLISAGEAGMQLPPAEVAPLRAEEQRRACETVGVSDLRILDFPDGTIEHGLPLRQAIARAIRDVRPDVVVTPTPELEPGWGINHADHRAVGLATYDAVRDADNTWVFPELARTEDLPKWGATWLLVSGHTQPTHYADVTGEPLQKGIDSLACHEAYLAELPGHPRPEEFLPQMTSGLGEQVGVGNAVGFRAYRLKD